MIVVTGASGLVGGNLVRALLSQGRPVRALVHHDRRALAGLDVETASVDLNELAKPAFGMAINYGSMAFSFVFSVFIYAGDCISTA